MDKTGYYEIFMNILKQAGQAQITNATVKR